MQISRTVVEARIALQGAKTPVGLVPTMGALHDGHLSLVKRARDECATVVASLFVNPTQFGPNEDFERYPRDEATDITLLERFGVDILFAPSVDEMYRPGDTTMIHLSGVSDRLEGEQRPGHFDGVATVVTKLLNIVQPDRAYFGEKDAQQLLVIRRMVADTHLPVEVVGCPTVRETDGLALSSRNVYLSTDEREQALSLSRGLRLARQAFESGELDSGQLRELVRTTIESQPLSEIDYISLSDAETLVELDGTIRKSALLSLAVRFGNTRLIDNVTLDLR